MLYFSMLSLCFCRTFSVLISNIFYSVKWRGFVISALTILDLTFTNSFKFSFPAEVNSRGGKNLSCSSSKFSSPSIPQTPRSEGEILQSPNIKNFSFSDLRTSTRNFRPDSVLGEGGFGSVFKGWVDEHSLAASKPGTGMVIAVKRLNREGYQGHREWLVSFKFWLLISFKLLELGLYKCP